MDINRVVKQVQAALQSAGHTPSEYRITHIDVIAHTKMQFDFDHTNKTVRVTSLKKFSFMSAPPQLSFM